MKVFISAATREFKACRDSIASDLRANGIEVRVQEDFLTESGTLLQKLEAYVASCDGVVLLIGRLYGAEPTPTESTGHPRRSYTQWEYFFAAGERLDGTRTVRKSMLVCLAKPEYPTPATATQTGDEAALQAAFMQDVLDSGQDRIEFESDLVAQNQILRHLKLPGAPNHKPNNLPFASLGALFKGREEFLQQIRETLGTAGQSGHHRAAAITTTQTAAVYGLGGIGKTRAAIEYARARAEEFTALLFVRADSPDSLQANLAALCGAAVLDLNEKDAPETKTRVHAALRWLEMHPGWLLIFDNVDIEPAAQAVEDLLSRLSPHGQVLITSRLSRWMGSVTPLAMGLLTSDASTDYLQAATPNTRKSATDSADARALVEALDRFPLALTQAAAYINIHDFTFAGYLQEWESKRREVMGWYEARLMQYPVSVAVTWQTSFYQLSEPARNLLRMLAWLAPDPLPDFLLETEAPGIEEGSPFTAQAMRTARVELKQYSLVTRDSDAPEFTVHRLVQDVTRSGMSEEERRTHLDLALGWVDAAFVGDPEDVRSWPVLDPLLPHALAVAERAGREGLEGPIARLLNQCGLLLNIKAQYVQAEPLMRRALAVDESSYGPEHPSVARDLNNLAQLLQATNRLAEAEPLMRRALAIDEASYGPEHPSVARDLNNLAQLLQATNRLAEAEPLMRRALSIDESSYGPEHPRVAIRLNNLAQLLQATNRLAEAEPLMRRALSIDESSYGPEHPEVATDLNNLAQLLQATNRLAEAEPLMRRALSIDESSYGPEHPRVAIRLNNLAQLLQDTNRLAEAEPLMRRALAIDEASYGPEHPSVATDLNNLAALLKATNRLAEAEPLMRCALTIFEASFGPEHPSTMTVRRNLTAMVNASKRRWWEFWK